MLAAISRQVLTALTEAPDKGLGLHPVHQDVALFIPEFSMVLNYMEEHPPCSATPGSNSHSGRAPGGVIELTVTGLGIE
ncbi:hypothetical protein [Marinobacter sp.]|uniref:hypothetical protein n=1 Tax=Marinobacter sp. TaxID=50741 RepID=UPI003A920D37